MPTNKPIKVEYRTLVAIWLGLLASQLIFVVAVYFAKPELLTPDTTRSFRGDNPYVTLAFAVIAFAFFILSFVLSHQHVRRAVRDQDAECVQTALLLGCALSEVASVLGLLLALLFDYPYFYLWIALGTLGVLMHFPRKRTLHAAGFKNI